MRRLSDMSFSRADREYMVTAPPEITALNLMVQSARMGLDGPGLDFAVLAGPWGFSPRDVTTEVRIWHGDDDRLIPLRHGEALAVRLPRAHLTVCPGQGHMMLAAQMPDIAREMGWLRSTPAA